MKTKTSIIFCAALVFCAVNIPLYSQNSVSSIIYDEHTEKKTEYVFPQWAKDLRRADIITFGVFPFTWLFTSLAIDLQRSYDHNWDTNYISLIAGAKSIAWGNDEYIDTLIISGALSVTIAVVDFVIIKIKRAKAAKRERSRSSNLPEIQRTPLNSTDGVSVLEPPKIDEFASPINSEFVDSGVTDAAI